MTTPTDRLAARALEYLAMNAAESGADALIEELACRIIQITQLADVQACDERLWFVAQTAPEAYLQQALRRLHAAIEAKSPEECAAEALASATTAQQDTHR